MLGTARAVAIARSGDAALFTRVIGLVDRLEYLYLAVCLIAGLLGVEQSDEDGSVSTAISWCLAKRPSQMQDPRDLVAQRL